MSNMKVANVFRYVMGANGKPNKKHKEKIRTAVLLEEDYIKQMNAETEVNGMEAVVLTKETADYYKKCEEINEERREAAERKRALAEAGLVDTLQKRNKKAGEPKNPEPPKKPEPKKSKDKK